MDINLSSTTIAGVSAFIATNLDDLLVLMLFFGRINAQRSAQSRQNAQYGPIILGQYLGFTILLIASLPGFFGGLVIPRAWLSLLGLLPIGLGIQAVIQNWLQRHEENAVHIATLASAEANPSKSPDASLGAKPNGQPKARFFQRLIPLCLISPLSQQVAAITIANGGDNLGIYVPLLANQNWPQLGIMVLVFYLMVGIWCGLAAWLTQHPIVTRLIRKYGDALVPFVLIALGLFILIDGIRPTP
jgi:cadmium resistance protein CadD (predicted permease)